MIVVYLGWRLVDIYLGTGHNAKPASREIHNRDPLNPPFLLYRVSRLVYDFLLRVSVFYSCFTIIGIMSASY